MQFVTHPVSQYLPTIFPPVNEAVSLVISVSLPFPAAVIRKSQDFLPESFMNASHVKRHSRVNMGNQSQLVKGEQ